MALQYLLGLLLCLGNNIFRVPIGWGRWCGFHVRTFNVRSARRDRRAERVVAPGGHAGNEH